MREENGAYMKKRVSKGGLSYIDAGNGRPVVFLHGWAMSGAVWERQLTCLSEKGIRTIAVDLRGHGDSVPEGPFTVSQYAYDLKGFIHELGLEKPVLVGWSMGVMVVLSFAESHPRIAEGVCLAGGTPRFTTTGDYHCGLSPKEVTGMKTRLKKDFSRCLTEFRESISKGLTEEDKRLIIDCPMPSFEAARGGLLELMNVDLREALEKISIPALLIHGDDDKVCPVEAARYIAEKIEGAGLLILEGAGHVPFLSRTQPFNEALEEFIGRI